jgi:hypothetical protein
MFHAFEVVDAEHFDGSPPHCGLAYENGTPPEEMLVPDVRAWIEKRHEFSGLQIIAGHVAPFGPVAVSASEARVLHCGEAAVFARADVIQLVRKYRRFLWELAVLALAVRPLPYLFATELRHDHYESPLLCKDSRALAWSKSRN